MKKIITSILLIIFLFGLFPSPVQAVAMTVSDGPHLLIDDYLIESKQAIIRRVNHPSRVSSTPVIPSIEMEGGDGTCSNFNYEVQAVFDPVDNKFKMWYVKYDPTVEIYPAHSVYRESIDGVTWGACRQVDFGVRFDNTQNKGIGNPQRFVSSSTRFLTDRTKRSMDLFFSANGLTWQSHPNNPVLTWEQLLPGMRNDIWDLYFDPLRQRYGVMTKAEIDHDFVDSRGQRQRYQGRTTHQNTSQDLTAWSAHATMLFPPGPQDEGKIQWYGCANATRRGDHLICFSKVLHDDFKSSDTPAQHDSIIVGEDADVYGIGYTVLAWSYDGDTWFRDRAPQVITGNNLTPPHCSIRPLPADCRSSGRSSPTFAGDSLVDLNALANNNNVFFAPNPNRDAWDHAHTWIDSVVPVGDELYLYYGGYKYGHKMYDDRGIGLAKIKKDRYAGQYVGVETTGRTGSITTKLIKTDADKLFLNMDTGMSADGPGRLQVKILNEAGAVLASCNQIGRVDSLSQEVTGCNFAQFKSQPIKLKFEMENAMLFAFYLDGEVPPTTPTPTRILTPTITPTPVQDLVCTSPKKGAATLYEENSQASQLGVSSSFYRYSPYSISHQTTPMLKKVHIDKLKANPNPDVCSYPDSQALNVANECPARGIKKVVENRGQGGYWLILNEPDGEEDQFYHGNVNQMVDDIAFSIKFIKQYDPEAKFIVAWYAGVQTEWPRKAPAYGLNPDINQVIAGWHIHTYHLASGFWNTSAIDNYFLTFKDQILNHPAKQVSSGKELWLTEFGTLMNQGSPNCNDLAVQNGCECRFDRVDNDPLQLCLYFMEKLVYWLESDQSPIDRYFWWSYGRCNPADLGGSIAGNRDLCFSALTTKEGGNIRLNNLGRAFTKIPNDNGVCRDNPLPPSLQEIILNYLGSHLDQNNDGLVNGLDFALVLP